MTADVGFCSKCGIVRQDDAYGPATPCACFVAHHSRDCRLRVAVSAWIAISCEEHGRDACPACFSCTCDVPPDRAFVVGATAFTWEADVGLMPAASNAEATP